MYTLGIICLILSIALYIKNRSLDFSIHKTALLKAIMPFFIVIGHCSIKFNTLTDLSKVGAFIVTIFFFISGYGLEKKRAKGDIDIYYLTKRIKSIILPLIIPAFFYLLTYYIIYGEVSDYLKQSVKTWNIILSFTWFLTKVIIIYVIFFMSSLLKKNNLLLFIAILGAFDLLCILCKAPVYTYLSDFGVILGIAFSKYQDIINNHQRIYTFITLLLFWVLLPMTNKGSILFIEISLFAIIFPIVISALPLKEWYISKFKFLSDFSYEVYILQGLSFLIVELLDFRSITLRIILVLLSTYVFAFLSKKITSYIMPDNCLQNK